MDIAYNLVLVLGLVFVFLFAIRKFSNQIERVAGDRFRAVLTSLTKTPLRGVALGAAVTAIIQSSTATTVLLVGLVDAGAITFANSLGVVFGANIGTAVTSQLVALKLIAIAPYILIIGFLINRTNTRLKLYGKAIFYFGLVFLCLAIISELIQPFTTDTRVLSLFSELSNPLYAVVAGLILAVFLQSSSVVSSVVILLVSQGLLDFYQAFGIILGSNIGTTSTALAAAAVMGKSAKRTALAHFLFNAIGVIIFLPFLSPFSRLVQLIDGSAAMQVANAHMIFNVINTVIFLVFLKPFSRLIKILIPSKK